jgi:hypothetical protein
MTTPACPNCGHVREEMTAVERAYRKAQRLKTEREAKRVDDQMTFTFARPPDGEDKDPAGAG